MSRWPKKEPVAIAVGINHDQPKFDKSFTFRLRRISGGSFSGLWELAVLGKSGNIEKLISDADALNYCLDNLQGELEAEGF